MSANRVLEKYLSVYYSVSGNTKQVSKLIKDQLNTEGQVSKTLVLHNQNDFEHLDIETYEHVFIGTPTYGAGKTPKPVLDFLRYILKRNDFILPRFSVFGTGDSQFPNYCRAVDEVEYHLSKKTNVTAKLKIEQYPVSKYQLNKITEFVNKSLGRNN